MKKPYVYAPTSSAVALEKKCAAWEKFAKLVKSELCKMQKPERTSPQLLCPKCGAQVGQHFLSTLEYACPACGWRTLQLRNRVFTQTHYDASEDGYKPPEVIGREYEVVSYTDGQPIRVAAKMNAASRGFDLWSKLILNMRFVPDVPPDIPDLPPDELIDWAEGLIGKIEERK